MQNNNIIHTRTSIIIPSLNITINKTKFIKEGLYNTKLECDYLKKVLKT